MPSQKTHIQQREITDYGSATLAGLPNVLLDWLQSVLYTPPREWSTTRLESTITWLFYSATSVGAGENSVPSGSARFSPPARYCMHHCTCRPSSLAWPMQLLDGDFDHQTRWRLSFHDRSTRRVAIVRFQSWRHESGTVCHPSSRHLHRCQ